MGKFTWQKKARELLGKDAIQSPVGPGDGQFALVAPCRDISFSLWPTLEEAQTEMEALFQCGGMCNPVKHYILDLQTGEHK